MDSTEQATASVADGAARPVWSLTVVHHPDPTCLGRRVVVADQEREVTLGREHASLDAAHDRKLSRVHAKVALHSTPSGDGLRVVDLESRNGTFVDGARVESASLSDGAVLGIGSLLLLVHRAPAVFGAPRSPRVAGVGHAIAAILDDVARLATRGDPVLFHGETGTGKGLLAEELHLASTRSGSFVHVRCAALADADAHARLFGARDRPGILGSADHGTLFLDGIDDTPAPLQAALVAFLDERTRDVRVVASMSRELRASVAEGRLRDDLAARFVGWSIEVPPLRARREDIVPIALKLLEGHDPTPTLHADLALALVRHDWPGNVYALEAVLERAVLEAQGPELRSTPRLASLLARDEPTTEPRAVAPSQAIARSGRWFTSDTGERVSLESRRTLAAILAALARAQDAGDTRALGVSDLLAIAWPGERVLPRAGASRVYVAITSLRRMGLRDVIERTAQGYRLDPRAKVRLVDE